MNNPDSKAAPANPFAKLLRSVLLGGASTLAVSAFAPSVFAQETSPPPATAPAEEEIVVTGIRGSLQRSLEVKRDAVGVVDAITAEDIGKFPDSNLAAAIQRIPGISVNRGTAMMGGVPTSTGDATQVTVRGFGPNFNTTLYDGRQVSTALNNRGFDFSAVGADFVGAVHVLKTPDPTLSSGAIGATINILYPKPFDRPGFRLAASASSSYAPDEGEYTPNGGVLYSDTFANDTFGILASLSYSDRIIRGNHINNQGWQGTHIDPCQRAGGPACPPTFDPDEAETTPTWFTQDWGIYQEHTEDERIDGRLVLQWRPSDSVLLTLNNNYSKDELTQEQYGYTIWFNSGSLRNITTNSNGTITNFIQPNTPTDFQGQVNGSVVENNETGFNARWDATDNLTFEFDIDRSVSKLNPSGELSSIDMDVGYGPSAPGGTNGVDIGVVVGGPNDLPYVTAFGPGGDQSRFLDATIIGSHVLPITSNRNENTVDQVRLQAAWAQDELEVRVGVQYLKNDVQLRGFDSFANNNWQAYSGYGPNSNNFSNDNPNDPNFGDQIGVDLPDEFFTRSFSTSDFISGFNGNGNLPPGILVFDPFQVRDYLQSLGNPELMNIPGFNNTVNYDGVYRIVENPGAHQDVQEENLAFFLSVSNETQIGGLPLRISVGVRYEETTTTSSGLGREPIELVEQSGDLTALNVIFGPQETFTAENTYRHLLPNLDINISLTDDLKLRFDASRTLTRPPLTLANQALLSPVLTVPAVVRENALTANEGNPNLLPFLSDNLDFGLEWYYAADSYFSAGVFLKEVTNFIVQGATTQTVNDVIDPTTGEPGRFAVTSNFNGPSARVSGLELALQHLFGDTGFGFQANATFVDTDKPYDASNISETGFAVTGLANSANLVAFYEKYGFHARVAVNWRDEYLDHFGQQQNNSRFGAEPTFVNESLTVDLSTSYDVNDNFTLYLEGLNLTDETFSTHGRFAEQILDVVDTGPRYTFGVRMRY